MSVSVGTLTIDLRANTASFQQSMDKMSHLSGKTANDIKKSLDKITAAGIAMAAAVATGTAALIRSSLDAADSMSKLAQSAGTTTETLSELNYAAGLSNVSLEQLGKGLEKLSVASFKAQNGNVQLQRIFQKLGVTFKDANGHLKDSGVLMEELAVKFAGLQDGSGKTALAIQLFGKAGAGLIPMLNQYGENQAKVNDEAHRFGLILGTSTAEVAAKAHDNLDRLGFVLKGIGFSLLNATLPALDRLLQKLVDIAKDANIPELAKSFGAQVTKTIDLLGDALRFVAKHTTALKYALEALLALQVGKFFVPFIADLAAGGITKLGAGVSRFTLSLLGLGRVTPQLVQFTKWVVGTTKALDSLAATEGLAATSAYALDMALSSLAAPLAVLAAVGFAFYEIAKNIKEARDAGLQFRDVLRGITPGNVAALLTGNVAPFAGAVGLSAAQHVLPARFKQMLPTEGLMTDQAKKTVLDTSGMGKPEKDIFGDEIRKLNEAIEAQRAYLAVLDATPDKIKAVASEEKARALIVEMNNRLTDAGRAPLTKQQEALIEQKIALQDSLEALNSYGKELVDQQHSTEVSTLQAKALAAAYLQGDAAVRQAAIDNAILALTYNRTAEELRQMAPEVEKLRALMTANESAQLVANTNKEIQSLQDEIEARKITNATIFGTIDAQREAALSAKLLTLNQAIQDEQSVKGKVALLAKRQAIIDLTETENRQQDIEAALALLSPTEQYERETDALVRATRTLAQLQGGMLTYGQQLTVAAKAQDEFNRLTDETINLLLRMDNAKAGVAAFFLKMQEDAITTAQIVFDALNQTFEKLSDNLAELITGGKANFAKMFEDIGKNMVRQTLQSAMQKGLGALGKALGVSVQGRYDGQSATTALFVQIARGTGVAPGVGGIGSPITGGGGGGPMSGIGGAPSPFGGGILGGLFGGLFGKLFGANKSSAGMLTGALPQGAFGASGNGLRTRGILGDYQLYRAIFGGGQDNGGSDGGIGSTPPLLPGGMSSIASASGGFIGSLFKFVGSLVGKIPMLATGGPVSPSSAYLVGEQGPEILTGVSGNIMSNTASRRMLGSMAGPNVYYSIDARGTDPVQTEQRTRAAIIAAHNSAVVTGVQADVERTKRIPQTSYGRR